MEKSKLSLEPSKYSIVAEKQNLLQILVIVILFFLTVLLVTDIAQIGHHWESQIYKNDQIIDKQFSATPPNSIIPISNSLPNVWDNNYGLVQQSNDPKATYPSEAGLEQDSSPVVTYPFNPPQNWKTMSKLDESEDDGLSEVVEKIFRELYNDVNTGEKSSVIDPFQIPEMTPEIFPLTEEGLLGLPLSGLQPDTFFRPLTPFEMFGQPLRKRRSSA